jgi:DUF4097 and DUF4098 domain-containing protein YvlB
MRPRSGSITGPLVLILIGVVFLIRSISPEFRIADLVARYWPYGLILWGTVALIEVFIRFRSNGPIPRNGISGGGWAIVIFVALFGSSVFQFERPDNWFRQVGFQSGIEAFGEEHQYPVNTITRSVGLAPRIIIEDFRGDAKISGTNANTISVTGQKNIGAFDIHDADKANSQSPVEVLTDGNTITIRCHQDRLDTRTSVSTNLDVSVPKGASIEASAARGSIDVSSLTGDIQLNGGNIEDVRLDDIGGNVKVDARGTRSIHCSNVQGTIELHGRGADVDLETVAGQVTVAGDYTGTISLRALAKPVRLESMHTQLDARQVTGYIRLDRGSLDAKDLVGPVKLSTKATDVTLAGFTEGLDLDVDRGDIELRPEHSAMGRIVVHARSGNIELAVPAAAHFALNANTENGDIDNQFGDALKETADGRGAKLEGSIGNGPDVNLVTQHGSITVRKATAEDAAETKAAALNLDR